MAASFVLSRNRGWAVSWDAVKQTLGAEVFVDVWPVDALAASD
jgi:hypothetical protein